MGDTADAGTTPATTHGVGGPAPTQDSLRPDTSTDAGSPASALIGATSASNASSAAGGPLPAPMLQGGAQGAEPEAEPSPKPEAEPAGDVPSIQQLAALNGRVDELAGSLASMGGQLSQASQDAGQVPSLAVRLDAAEAALAQLAQAAPAAQQLETRHMTALEHICAQLGLS